MPKVYWGVVLCVIVYNIPSILAYINSSCFSLSQLHSASCLSTTSSSILRCLSPRDSILGAGDALTVADLKTFVTVRALRSGSLDHVPTDLVGNVAPNLAAHQERIGQEPVVEAYYADRA